MAEAATKFRSPFDTLPSVDADRWRGIEAACRAWTRTRERPHPPLPDVVQYVIPAGEVVWTDGGVAKVKAPIVLDWPPNRDVYPSAEWNPSGRRWQRPAGNPTVAYHVVPVDLRLYEHLFSLGLLCWPAGETIDNRVAPGA